MIALSLPFERFGAAGATNKDALATGHGADSRSFAAQL